LYAAQKEELEDAGSRASHPGAVMAKTHTVMPAWPERGKQIPENGPKEVSRRGEKLISSDGVGL
jgi:hypothetical protein